MHRFIPKFRIAEHPGREQPFTTWRIDSYPTRVWHFDSSRVDAELYVERCRGVVIA